MLPPFSESASVVSLYCSNKVNHKFRNGKNNNKPKLTFVKKKKSKQTTTQVLHKTDFVMEIYFSGSSLKAYFEY